MAETKILIVGFQRSGTTLVRRLLVQHPKIQGMLHETSILLNRSFSDVENLLRHTYKIDINKTWGEKVPYSKYYKYGPKKDGGSFMNYCTSWNKFFGEDARILHIVRHPYDVIISSWWTFGAEMSKIASYYSHSTKKILLKLSNFENVLTFKFEEFISDPVFYLDSILRFCNLDNNPNIINSIANSGEDKLRYYDKIEKSKIFSYKKYPIVNFNLGSDLRGVMNRINSKLGGMEYEF